MNTARFSAVGVSVMLPNFTAVGVALCTTVRVSVDGFSAVGVGVMLPILLLSIPPFTLRQG